MTTSTSNGLTVKCLDKIIGYSKCYHCDGRGNFKTKRTLEAKNFLERIRNFFDDQYDYRTCPLCEGKGKKPDVIPGDHVYYKDGVQIPQMEWLEEAFKDLSPEERRQSIEDFLYRKSERDHRVAMVESTLKVLNSNDSHF